jgi:hypothetical protein
MPSLLVKEGTFIICWSWHNGLLLGNPFLAGRSWLRPLPDDNQDRETGHEFAGLKRASRKKLQSRKIGILGTSPLDFGVRNQQTTVTILRIIGPI